MKEGCVIGTELKVQIVDACESASPRTAGELLEAPDFARCVDCLISRTRDRGSESPRLQPQTLPTTRIVPANGCFTQTNNWFSNW